jgi:hypothetical protein
MTRLLSDLANVGSSDATALQHHITAGKTAYIVNGKVSGTYGLSNGLLVDQLNVIDNAIGNFNPDSDDNLIFLHPSAVNAGSSIDWDRDVDGYAWHDTLNPAIFIDITSIPAQQANVRKYELFGKWVGRSNDHGFKLFFNVANPTTNHWYISIFWFASNGTFRLELHEVTSSIDTLRASVNENASMDVPCQFHLIVYDQGDDIICHFGMYETDSIIDREAVSINYNAVGRPNKTATGFRVTRFGATGSEGRIRGCRVTDL